MQKIMKMLLVVILGLIGTCALIWALGITSNSVQEASARGETFGIIVGVVLLAAIGAAIFKYTRGKP